MQAASTSGAMARATSAAAPALTPSRMTGRTQRGAAEQQADHRRVLQAADGREHADGVGRVGLVQLQRAADDLDLAGVRLVVDAGAAAGDLGRVGAGEDGDQGGRDGGVGDAHLAGEQRLVAGRDQVAGGLDAHLDRGA